MKIETSWISFVTYTALFTLMLSLESARIVSAIEPPIEENVPERILATGEGWTLVNRLKQLRVSEQRLGSKHPSRKSVEIQIADAEKQLREMVLELNSTEGGKTNPFRQSESLPLEIKPPKNDSPVQFAQPLSKTRPGSTSDENLPKGIQQQPSRLNRPRSDVASVQPYRVEAAYPNLHFVNPTAVGPFPARGLMWTITHENSAGGGKIMQWQDGNAAAHSQIFLQRSDVIDTIAFHPKFAENGLMFVGCHGFSERLGKHSTSVIRYTLETKPPFVCNLQSEKIIVEWPSGSDDCGAVAFGTDGMLYVAAGGRANSQDPNRSGQTLSNFQRSILRIDVDHPMDGTTYSIPNDNPFLKVPDARGEIWAYGLCDPGRIVVNMKSRQIWVTDRSEDGFGRVYMIRRGENYGGSIVGTSRNIDSDNDLRSIPVTLPIVEHDPSIAKSLTGSVVYQGKNLGELDGALIYSDLEHGNLWGVFHDGTNLVWKKKLASSALKIVGLGIDTHDELLIVSSEGEIHRLAKSE